MRLIKINQDTQPLIDDLFPLFKEHLRILHDIEDEMIKLYLAGAIEAISTFGDNDIFHTAYSVFYTGERDIRYPSSFDGWYCGKWDISDVQIYNSAGIDKTSDYTIDFEHGMIYPHPMGDQVSFVVGYISKDDIPPMLTSIIFRYGASLFEMREDTRIGEPKALPMWLTHALASVWCPRV